MDGVSRSRMGEMTRVPLMSELKFRRTWGPIPNYPLVKERSTITPGGFFDIAGPCSIESDEQANQIAAEIKKHGIKWMRGGIYRAGTYPGRNFGLPLELLKEWWGVEKGDGLKSVVEVLDVREISIIDQYADAFQVGARHMQDYALLKELSRTSKPVTIKRSPGSTLDEFLGAVEYLCGGSCYPIMIERGGSTHHTHVRWDLSISIIAAVKKITGIPILVDASHGTGRRDLVLPMTLAGIAAGADGFLVETHPDPDGSLSDADQAYPLSEFGKLVENVDAIRKALIRKA